MSDLAFQAMLFARLAHEGHTRKYTHEPYWGHLAEVTGIVSTLHYGDLRREIVLACAWLHDCVEDRGIQLDQIERLFGSTVAYGVMMLSDMEAGNRADRKAASRLRLASAHGWVQSIKCADLISNTKSIVMHDPKFAVTYLEEKRLLLDVMTKADPRLLAMAKSQAGYSD